MRMREEAACQVIEQVRTHAGQLEDERDARSLERFPQSDARELEEVWSSDRSRAEDHLALGERFLGVARLAVEAIGHSSSPPALDDDASDESLRDDGQIRPAAGRAQVAVGDAEPPPAPLRDRNEAHAAVVGAVQVVARGNPARLRGVDERLGEDVRVSLLRQRERAIGTPPKRRLRGRPRPTGAPVRLPRVVGGMAAEDHHRVHRRGSAERPTPGKHDLPPVERRLRNGGVAPIERRSEELREGGGDLGLELPRARAGLDQEDGEVRVLGETRGENAAGGSRPHDHDVARREMWRGRLFLPKRRLPSVTPLCARRRFPL